MMSLRLCILFKAKTSGVQECWGHSEVTLRGGDMDMPQRGGEVGQQALHIGSCLIPGHKPMHGPGVAQVMQAGLITCAVVAAHRRFLTRPAEDALSLLTANGLARARQQERRLGGMQQWVARSLLGIGAQRCGQAWTNGYPARLVKLARADGQQASGAIDISQCQRQRFANA